MAGGGQLSWDRRKYYYRGDWKGGREQSAVYSKVLLLKLCIL